MCRLAAYIAESPISLAALLYDPPHSLEHAAYAPNEMLTGNANVDGTGAAWWQECSYQPLRYVTTEPPWSDPNLPNLARHLVGVPILTAVRSATPGMPYGPANVAPFVDGGLAGCHNGWIGGFGTGLGRRLSLALSEERFGHLGALNDSLLIFSLVAQLREDRPGLGLADSVAETVESVAKEVVAAGERATLNLVVASRDRVVATRTSVDFGVNSLYLRKDDAGVWLASEPLDEVGGARRLTSRPDVGWDGHPDAGSCRCSPVRFGGDAPVTVSLLTEPRDRRAQMMEEVRIGLTAFHKHLPSKYFYDGRGSELFVEITHVPEYYLTRSELEIIEANADRLMGLVNSLPRGS